MSEVAPDYTKLFIPTIQILEASGGQASVGKIVEKLLEKGFPAGSPHKDTNRSELDYQAAWARSYLKIYGALENPSRGVWKLGTKAKDVSSDSISKIVSEVVAISNQKAKLKKKSEIKVKLSTSKTTPKTAPSSSKPSTPSRSIDVSTVDQAKTILSLLEKGFITKTAANEALLKLGDGSL